MLARVSRKAAQHFMEQHEHLGDLGLGVWHWGLSFDGELVGVVSYGTTCFSVTRSWIGQVAREAKCGVVQLCRGGTAAWVPRGTASYLIARANKAMAGIRGPLLVVAYASPESGEVGTVYQAANATYTGMTNPKGQANYLIDGRPMSGWKVRKLYGTRDRGKLARVVGDLRVVPLQKKYRYIMVVGPGGATRRARRLLTPYSRPYPKRDGTGIPSMVGMVGVPDNRPSSWPETVPSAAR